MSIPLYFFINQPPSVCEVNCGGITKDSLTEAIKLMKEVKEKSVGVRFQDLPKKWQYEMERYLAEDPELF